MRLFVFLLILANLLFFAWTHQYLGLPRDSDAYRLGQQLLADQIRIVSNDQPPAVIARPEKAAKPLERTPVDVCVVLGEMPLADVESLESLLAEKLRAFKVVRTTVPGSSSYWVHIPPLKNKREVESKTAELKKFGIKDFFVVQESGPNNLAISLGLFSTQEAAEFALEGLRDKGVRSARISERVVKPALASLEIRGPEAQEAEMNQIVGQAAPDARRSGCKPRSVSGQ